MQSMLCVPEPTLNFCHIRPSTPVPQTESSKCTVPGFQDIRGFPRTTQQGFLKEAKPGASRSSHVEELPIDEHRDKMLEQIGSGV